MMENKIYYGYYVLMILAGVMGVVMWGSAQPHLNDFWRWMYFICADVILLVIIIGGYYITKNITKGK